MEIPQSYEGTELAVFPTGKYEKRGLSFHAYYYDENGSEKPVLSGVWKVNGEIYTDGEAQINAGDFYTVEFEYDPSEYYYVDAGPVPFSTEQGRVGFREENSLSDVDTYSVQLRRYITAGFSYDGSGREGIASVSVKDSFADSVEGSREGYAEEKDEIKGLKAGDIITIETEDGYRIFCSGLMLQEPEEIGNGYRYVVTVPETNERRLEFKVCKSELKVVLDKTVGYDMLFDIAGSGVNKKNCSYAKQTLNKDLTIFDGTIGVEKQISITAAAENNTLESGYALKAEIEKIDGNGQKVKEIKYIDKIPGSIAISLYNEPGEIINLNKVYKSVSVEISLASVVAFKARTIENGTISVKLTDSPKTGDLSEGDITEASQKVIVTIIPDEGYYVSGKNTDHYRYTDTMKISKYESDINKIIKTHKIKKLYQITLDESDAYGLCVYKLNGETVSGTINIREEGDELTLEYELTDAGCRIIRESDGFWGSINDWRKNTFSKAKETVTIPVSANMDGATIKRDDYIKVEKKGEQKDGK